MTTADALPSSSTASRSHLAQDDIVALQAGVSEIAAPGVPGPLCVYGPEAFVVAVGDVGGLRAPAAAAGRWEAGRVVALGHGGYFGAGSLDVADTGRFIANALGWAAGKERTDASLRIGVVGAPELSTWLEAQGMDVAEATLSVDGMAGRDVIAVGMWNQSADELDALATFVRSGGGLVTASTGWGWAQLHPDQQIITDYSGNRLLASVGIQWPYDWLSRTGPNGYTIDGAPDPLVHAGLALDAVEAQAAGTRTLTEDEGAQALDSLVRAATCLPPDDTLLAPRLRALIDGATVNEVPSPEQPITRADVLDRLAATLFTLDHRRMRPEDVRPHPAAASFPGSVPADAPRVTRSLVLDSSRPRWHSTGLYAAPGELVTVTVPISVARAGGAFVRVGAHSDGIWGRPDWTRMPEISRRFAIDDADTRVANAFGGLVYVELPAGLEFGRIVVRIAGAVEAPRFVLGETDPAAWRDTIRHAPAPWAEIEGRAMIVTTDAREVRALDDPAAVARTWDRVLDLGAELAAWGSPERASPERFVVDRLISVGYMHAGYPLMAHLDQQANIVSAEHLRSEGNWGFFHEVGHNHQSGDWTFGGTGEVTVNLFTLYTYENLVGIPVAENERGSDAFLATQMAKYDFANPDFAQWQSDPFLALTMYVQLQRAFGWDAYRNVFAEYRALPAEQRPPDDAAKRDQWMVRFSRSVGFDLGPFFAAWGIPVSTEARASIADLPRWMPQDFPPGASATPEPGAATPTPGPASTPMPTVTAIPTVTPLSEGPIGPTAKGRAYFQIAFHGRSDTFVVALDDPARIADARAELVRPIDERRGVIGIIQKEPAAYNPPWSFHYDPETVDFFDFAIEVCDGSARYIEDHLDEACGALLPDCRWCPWSSYLAAEIEWPPRIYLPLARNDAPSGTP